MLVAESKEAKAKLEVCRVTLKGKVLRISRTKIEYLKCNFSGEEQVRDIRVTVGGNEVANLTKFQVFRLIIQSDRR